MTGRQAEAIVEQVNATTKLTRLDQWLRQVLDADHLTAIDWAATITTDND